MLRPLKLLPFAFIATTAFLQAQTPTAQPPQNSGSGVTTLKADARLVVLDVVVTDKNQRPVHNLKPSDFTVLESNTPQTIKNFEEHSALSSADIAKLPPIPRLPPGLFTNYSPVPPGALNVLLLDALNTQIKDQPYIRDQLREYLKNAPAGMRIAIFSLNSRLILLQGFTSDISLLKTALERSSSGASLGLRSDPVGTGGFGNSPVSTAIAEVSGGAGDIGQLMDLVKQSESDQATTDAQLRSHDTLDAMNQIAHYLAGMPGRKNLIWFSSSFPIAILPDPSLLHPFKGETDSDQELRETTNLLARSQVAVYPIAARGVTTANLVGPLAQDHMGGGDFTISAVTKGQQDRFESDTSESKTMNQIAESTGGHAYLNTNGLSEAVGKAIANGSNYYTLTYTPTDPGNDSGFRKIQIKLQQQGLTLNYNHGYYPDKAKSVTPSTDAATPAASMVKTMDLAMVHGAPTPSEIMIKARVLPSSSAAEDTLAPGNSPNAKLKDPVKGPYRRYIIDIAADPNDVSLHRGQDGKFTGDLQVMTFVYDQNGILIDTTAKSIHTDLTPDGYRQLYQHGLQLHQEVSVPLKGTYYLRVGLHDLTSNRVGAIEVPVASIRALPPAPAPAPTPVPPGAASSAVPPK